VVDHEGRVPHLPEGTTQISVTFSRPAGSVLSPAVRHVTDSIGDDPSNVVDDASRGDAPVVREKSPPTQA
jgi:hypothetical protein